MNRVWGEGGSCASSPKKSPQTTTTGTYKWYWKLVLIVSCVGTVNTVTACWLIVQDPQHPSVLCRYLSVIVSNQQSMHECTFAFLALTGSLFKIKREKACMVTQPLPCLKSWTRNRTGRSWTSILISNPRECTRLVSRAQLVWSWIKSKLSCQLVSEYETDSLPKRLHRKVENETNGPGFSSCKLMQFAGWRISVICD